MTIVFLSGALVNLGDGSPEAITEGRARALKALRLIETFSTRYDDIRNRLSPVPGKIDIAAARDLEELCGEIFWVWEVDSHKLLEGLGQEKTFEILELCAGRRAVVWEMEAYQYWEKIDDRISIYRGGLAPAEELSKGYSWSLNHGMAKVFAMKVNDGIVLKAEISKNDILLINYFESEVVPRLAALSNIDVVVDAVVTGEVA